jgi:UDP-N-acetylmuramoyl-tripeptide--D-alanyl-D-alanine ligase
MPSATKARQFSVGLLAEVIKAECLNEPRGMCTGVSTDSRTLRPGDCFFAIGGDNFDGHRYVAEAFARGASCTVVCREIPQDTLGSGCVLKVANTINALGDFARWYRLRNGFRVVAITGSVGKTTTRQVAYHVLSHHFRTSQSPKNFNNQIGLPLTLLNAEPDDEIVVAELGTNHPGEIAGLARIAGPDVAVITNVHLAHLEGFEGFEDIVREKLSISEGLRPDGIMIVNRRVEQLVRYCRTKALKSITFGFSDNSDVSAASVTHTAFGSTFVIDSIEARLPLPGPGNVESALAAWAVCTRFGLTAEDFARAVGTLRAVPMRTEVMQVGTLTVLNDCYNANPASMDNALTVLDRVFSERGGDKSRCVFICADMAELGDRSAALHEQLGWRIAESGVQVLITAGKFATLAAEAAKAKAERRVHTVCFDDTPSLCDRLDGLVRSHDVILVKGSRVARLETVVEKLRELFSNDSPDKAKYAVSYNK